jgi:hypothetical protein
MPPAPSQKEEEHCQGAKTGLIYVQLLLISPESEGANVF